MLQSRAIIVAVLAAVGLVACAAQPTGQGPNEAACAARGLTPGTVEFAACLRPSDAAALQGGEAAWEQMQDVDEK